MALLKLLELFDVFLNDVWIIYLWHGHIMSLVHWIRITSCNRLILSLASFVATFVCAQLISHEIHAEGSSATPLDQEIATLNFGEFTFHALR